MTSEKKNKTVFDRSGRRFWSIPSAIPSEDHETGHHGSRRNTYRYCCPEHDPNFHGGRKAHESESEDDTPKQKRVVEEIDPELLHDSDDSEPFNLPAPKHLKPIDPVTALMFPKFDGGLNPVYSESDDDAVSTTGLASSSQCGTSPKTFFPTGKVTKMKLPSTSTEITVPLEPESDSLWQSKTLGEERDLSVKFWLSLPYKEKRSIVKVGKDMKGFFSDSLDNNKKGGKGFSGHSKSNACVCPDCDPRRSFMQVQFDAFYSRYKMAQSMNAAAVSEFADTKPPKEITQEELKKKTFKIAQSFLENDGKAYTEMSSRLQAEQLRVVSCCGRHSKGCSSDNSDAGSTDGSSSESFPDTVHHVCEHSHSHSHAHSHMHSHDHSHSHSHSHSHHGHTHTSHTICEREAKALFAAQHGLEELSCGHASLSSMAAHMMGLNGAHQTSRQIKIHGKTIEINSKTIDMTHVGGCTSADRAPFPAANPPAGIESSSKPSSAEKECAHHCPIHHVDETASESSTPEEHFRLALERATDDDSLVKIYVAKLFDYRILNAYRDMLIQQRQLKLIEEYENEEKKSKSKPKSKKDKKKPPKNTKQFEEALARKREENRLEEQAEKRREAEAIKLAERRQREKEEHAAQVQRARAINRQAREEAEKTRKFTKIEPSPATLKPSRSVERPPHSKPTSQPKPATLPKPPAPRAQPPAPKPTIQAQPLATKPTIQAQPPAVKPVIPAQPPAPKLISQAPAVKPVQPPTAKLVFQSLSSSSPKAPPKSAPIATPKRVIVPPAAPNPILDTEWPSLNTAVAKKTKDDAPKSNSMEDYTSNGSPPFGLTLPWSTEVSSPYAPDFATPFTSGFAFAAPLRPFFPTETPFTQTSHITPAPLDKPSPFAPIPPPSLGDSSFASRTAEFAAASGTSSWPLTSAVPFDDDDLPITQIFAAQLCNDPLALQIQENARHSYFSLLMDMGIGLAIQPKDRPFVPFSQLYLKYTSLFSDRVVTLAQFYQFCSVQISSNPFQFQPDPAHAYPSVRYFLSLAPISDAASTSGFLSTLQINRLWAPEPSDISLRALPSIDPLTEPLSPFDAFAPLSPPSLIPTSSDSTSFPSHMISTLGNPFLGESLM